MEVAVAPSNRGAPKFSSRHQVVSVDENLPVGTRLTPIKPAVDGDAGHFGSISYRLLGDSETFSLDPKTGRIYFASS